MTLTLYTKNNCSYCMMAKGFLKNNDVEYSEINIEEDTTAREFLLTEGHRTMPQVYLNGKLFVSGGWEGLRSLGIDAVKAKLSTEKVDVSQLGGI